MGAFVDPHDSCCWTKGDGGQGVLWLLKLTCGQTTLGNRSEHARATARTEADMLPVARDTNPSPTVPVPALTLSSLCLQPRGWGAWAGAQPLVSAVSTVASSSCELQTARLLCWTHSLSGLHSPSELYAEENTICNTVLLNKTTLFMQ